MHVEFLKAYVCVVCLWVRQVKKGTREEGLGLALALVFLRMSNLRQHHIHFASTMQTCEFSASCGDRGMFRRQRREKMDEGFCFKFSLCNSCPVELKV